MRFLFPTLLILVAVLMFYFLTIPKLESVGALRDSAATVNQALDKARELVSIRDIKQKELNNFSPDTRARLEKFLPDRIDNVRLIIDLIALADRYNMEIKNPQIEAAPKGSVGADLNKFDSVDLSFSVNGTYDIFQRFLADMEQSLRLIDVTSLSFTAGEKDTYDYNVTIRTYWLK